MRCATFTAVVTAAALSLAPAWAWAGAEPRAGVLPLDVEGKLPPKGAKALAAGFAEGLVDAGAALVPADELTKAFGTKKGTRAKDCRDAACLQGAAAKATATHLVRPSVAMQDSDYVIAIALVDGTTGETLHEASQTCELCGLTEAQEVARSLAASLADHLAALGTVAVQSTPTGAEVLVDGEPAGTTPMELRLAAGDHALTLRLAGHADDEQRVVVKVGATTTVAAELAVVPSSPVVHGGEVKRPEPRLRPLGWAALGVGIASLGSGIALLVLDERPVELTRCSGTDVDVEGNCRFRHDTLAGGVVMTVVGVVGIATGAILVARSRKGGKGNDRRAQVRPSLRGLAIEF